MAKIAPNQAKYQIASPLTYLRNMGYRAGTIWYLNRLVNMATGTVPPLTFQPRPLLHPIIARLGNSSDQLVIDQFFAYRELDRLRAIDPPPKTVLDLGANIGCASAWFLSVWPKCHVIAVEPDPNNITVLECNLAQYGNRVTIKHGAVWNRCCALSLSPHELSWASQVRERDADYSGITVPAWDMRTLLSQFPAGIADLVKIDIEGAELELFNAIWLHKVRNLAIEFHNQTAVELLQATIQPYTYHYRRSGEYNLLLNIRPQPIKLQTSSAPL